MLLACTTGFTALVASAGLAIGLAVKDSLANFASGIMILLTKPYQINDQVDAGGKTGVIQDVRLFSTILRTADNVKIIVPNTAITKSNIKSYSAYDKRRVDLDVSVGYEHHIGKTRDLLTQTMASHPLVLPEPAPSGEVLELGDIQVKLALRSWTSRENYLQVRSDLLEQIKQQLVLAGTGEASALQATIEKIRNKFGNDHRTRVAFPDAILVQSEWK
jgi:small conductance mechanosensitive channel